MKLNFFRCKLDKGKLKGEELKKVTKMINALIIIMKKFFSELTSLI